MYDTQCRMLVLSSGLLSLNSFSSISANICLRISLLSVGILYELGVRSVELRVIRCYACDCELVNCELN